MLLYLIIIFIVILVLAAVGLLIGKAEETSEIGLKIMLHIIPILCLIIFFLAGVFTGKYSPDKPIIYIFWAALFVAFFSGYFIARPR